MANLIVSISDEPCGEEKENNSPKKILSPVQDDYQFSNKNMRKVKTCETPKSRTPKQQKLNFSGGKFNSTSKLTARATETKDDIKVEGDRGTPQGASLKVLGKKRRGLPNR